MSELTLGWTAILGIVEGLTEFIPVSSTGHLILASEAAGIRGHSAETFEIFIQLGAILAVVWLYWKRFIGLVDFSSDLSDKSGDTQQSKFRFKHLFGGLIGDTQQRNSFKGLVGLAKLFVACIPAFVLGAIFSSSIKAKLFAPLPVAIAMILGGIVMYWVERKTPQAKVKRIEEISYLQCLGIGLFQCCALWPGISRSASTIIGGMLLGLERQIAAEFSFLVAVPVIMAATCYDMLKSFSSIPATDIPFFGIGLIVSFFTAILAVKFFVNILARHTLMPFAVYRICAGIAVLVILGM